MKTKALHPCKRPYRTEYLYEYCSETVPGVPDPYGARMTRSLERIHSVCIKIVAFFGACRRYQLSERDHESPTVPDKDLLGLHHPGYGGRSSGATTTIPT